MNNWGGKNEMKYEKIVDYVNEILDQYSMPLTLRQIFYRLVASYEYPNKSSAYTQLSKQLVLARIREHIDESLIEDRSREFLGGDHGFEDPQSYFYHQTSKFLSSPKHYNRRMWTTQPEFVVVWVEKDALSRVFSKIAERFNVVTAPSRGYASYTYIIKAIEQLPADKPTTILHFADHDPSGLDMTRDLHKRFNEYSGLEVKVERIALNHGQVETYHLSPNPTKTADPRASDYIAKFGNQCWELDAIEPSELESLVSKAITKHIDVAPWKKTFEQEKKERQKLETLFSSITKLLENNGYL